jgi:bacterial leucyl aminopeptidase
MLRTRFLPLVIASTLLCVGNNSFAAEKKVWITVGEAAYAQLQTLNPNLVASESKLIGNGNTSSLTKQERVYLVQVEEDFLPTFSESLHEQSNRCGGFIFHASQAEGSAALNKTQISPTLGQTRPNYGIRNQSTVNAALPLMQGSNIAQTIIDLSTNFPNRYYTTSGGVNASNWLLQKWSAMAQGRSDINVSQFTHPNWPQKSVILTINGSDNANEVVVLGAHLDSVNSRNRSETAIAPGADDDASGVASLTEALRAMIATNYKPRRTIKFMAYAAEEVGLRGSGEIATSFANNGVNVVGVIQLDMTNYKGAANDIYIFTDYTDSAQNAFIETLIRTYQPTLGIGYDVCNYGCSDHASWSNNGYPASMPFESSFSTSNRNIHGINDTFANSGNQALHALKFSKLAASFAIELGSDGPGIAQPDDKVEYFYGRLTQGQNKVFGPFKVAAGGALLAKTTGIGDMDLYVRKNITPTTSGYDCRSITSTAVESCRVNVAANGDVYVMVNGDTAGSYKLSVSYRPQSVGVKPVASGIKPVVSLKR